MFSEMMLDKIQGMFLGIAIGDSLGMPVETWHRSRILEKYPLGILKYETPDGHKWFQGHQAGTVTDDTNLTLAVAKGMIEGKSFDMDFIVKAHIEEMKRSTDGWGNTTRLAVRNLSNGVSYKVSGKLDDPGTGVGNGVIMKIAPLAAWRVSPRVQEEGLLEKIIDFSTMTHFSKMATYASLIHFNVLSDCLLNDVESYNPNNIFYEIKSAIDALELMNLDRLNDAEDDLEARLNTLSIRLSLNEIAQSYRGSCYLYDSLPYIYSHWLLNYKNLNLLFDSINYGGFKNDSDTNASVLGGMLGALHGTEIFDSHLIDGLVDYNRVMQTANDFYDCFFK